jgi:hypothetical protein
MYPWANDPGTAGRSPPQSGQVALRGLRLQQETCLKRVNDEARFWSIALHALLAFGCQNRSTDSIDALDLSSDRSPQIVAGSAISEDQRSELLAAKFLLTGRLFLRDHFHELAGLKRSRPNQHYRFAAVQPRHDLNVIADT